MPSFNRPQEETIEHYKFLDTKDVDRVTVDGTMLVSSLEYFRRLEETEWADIGDPLEGATELTVKGDFIIREGSPELATINSANVGLGMFQKFAAVSDGGLINISNVRFIHQVPNLYIYSVSVGNIDDLTTRMCVTARRPYDACLRITDLRGLQRTIFQRGRIRDLDCEVSEIFLPGLIATVQYEPRLRDITQGSVIEPSPFKKAEKFSGQSEVRVLFIPKEGIHIPKERLIIELPEASTFFEGVFRNGRHGDAPKT